MKKGTVGRKQEMTLISSKDRCNWNDKISVLKGNFGESIVTEYLIDKGYIPYRPDAPGAHPFDRLCATPDKKRIFIAEIKTKPARTHYPDTGIDIRHYKDYENIKNTHNLEVFLFFVDQDRMSIYGNKLSVLSKQIEIEHNGRKIIYPLQQYGIIYFPLSLMVQVGVLTNEQGDILEKLSTRNKAYIGSNAGD